MKLLLDEKSVAALSAGLLSLFGLVVHVRDVGLQRCGDTIIWDWAKLNGYTVVTTDSDFVAMSEQLGCPPKLIHIERCDYPFRVIEAMLRTNAVRISEFDKDESAALLSLRFSAD